MLPMNEKNLQLLQPCPVYGYATSTSASDDFEHPDVTGEWNIFRFSRISNVDQFILDNHITEKIEIDVNAGEMIYVPFNFWYQIMGTIPRNDEVPER